MDIWLIFFLEVLSNPLNKSPICEKIWILKLQSEVVNPFHFRAAPGKSLVRKPFAKSRWERKFLANKRQTSREKIHQRPLTKKILEIWIRPWIFFPEVSWYWNKSWFSSLVVFSVVSLLYIRFKRYGFLAEDALVDFFLHPWDSGRNKRSGASDQRCF